MKIIEELVKLAILAGITTFVLCFIYLFVKIKITRYKFRARAKRKINTIKALGLYWEDNWLGIRDILMSQEMAEIEVILSESKTDESFKKCLKNSKISYCYEYYLKIEKTSYANELLDAQFEEAIKKNNKRK
jgi:hypothetical protein